MRIGAGETLTLHERMVCMHAAGPMALQLGTMHFATRNACACHKVLRISKARC